MKRILVWFLLSLAAALPAAAQGLPGLFENGSTVVLPFSLTGFSGNLTVTFGSVTGASAPNLGMSVHLVSPLDPTLSGRLPSGVSVPAGFPVVVRIEPSPTGGLAFTGAATIELTPTALLLPPNSQPRLYAANNGGPYSDTTTSIKNINYDTSYRVTGSKGGFSEFVIVKDSRPLDTVITGKLDKLDQILADNGGAIAAPVEAALAAELAAARSHFVAGDATAALADLDALLATVDQHSGQNVPDIPNVWRASGGVTNVAGLLTAGAQTLQFSLRLKP